MEAFQDFEEKIMCPYDKAHYIRKSKMGVHLVKCAKNYPDAEIVSCDFNATHRIPKPELRYHHEICVDRRKIENHIIQKDDEEDASVKYPIQQINVECEENWDDEPEHPSYNPAAYCEQNNVLRHMDVQSASKRRNFRLEERHRLNNFRVVETSRGDPRASSNAYPDPRNIPTRTSNHIPSANTSRMSSKNTDSSVSSQARKGGPATVPVRTSSNVNVDEEAPHLSLADRIRMGNKKTYDPTHQVDSATERLRNVKF